MAFSGNNQSIYNAAYNGFIGGAVAGRGVTDPTASDYSSLATAAIAFATEVDANVPTDAELSTGAAGTTIAPSAGVNAAAAYAKTHLMYSLCFGYWAGRYNVDIVTSDYLTDALAIKAVYTEGVAGYASAPGGTSLT